MRTVQVSTRTILTSVGVLLGAVVGLWLLTPVWDVLLLMAVSLILAAALMPAVDWIEGRTGRRGLAVVTVIGAVLLAEKSCNCWPMATATGRLPRRLRSASTRSSGMYPTSTPRSAPAVVRMPWRSRSGIAAPDARRTPRCGATWFPPCRRIHGSRVSRMAAGRHGPMMSRTEAEVWAADRCAMDDRLDLVWHGRRRVRLPAGGDG
jgi:hypothetical protein